MNNYQKFIYLRTYARWDYNKNRRETWEETVDRYFDFMEKRVPSDYKQKFKKIKKDVVSLNVMPSMRAIWSAGEALEKENISSYNCSYITVDRIKAFSEAMYILMCGTGVGFSVERQYVTQLPEVPEQLIPVDDIISFEDSREGWARGYEKLLTYLYDGKIPQFDYSKIRPLGSVLKTFGGRASGFEPLRNLCEFTVNLFNNAKARKLESVECNDLLCFIAKVVVAGGTRRSACLSLSNLSDDKMRKAKTGSELSQNPQRYMANNSAVYTSKPKMSIFLDEWRNLMESGTGERGIFNREGVKKLMKEVAPNRVMDFEAGCNPCFTGDTIIAVADGRNGVSIKKLADDCIKYGKGYKFPVYSAKHSTKGNNQIKKNKKPKWVKTPEVKYAIAFKTGIKQVLKLTLSDGSTFRCTEDHMLAIPSGGYIEAKNSLNIELEKFFTFSNINTKKSYRHINSLSNGYARQYRLMYEFYKGIKENCTIDHIDGDTTNDKMSNLKALSYEEHNEKSRESKLKENNPIHRANGDWVSWNLKKQNRLANKTKYNWSEERYELELNKFLSNNPEPILEEDKNIYLNSPVKVIKIEKDGIEDVYDLTVEDNHNFYIITNTHDERYLNCSGILVHNCSEIILRPQQFCNLTEVIIRPKDTLNTIQKKIKTAVILGCVQSTLTKFNYIDEQWKENSEKERLLGVSLTGLRDHEVLGHIETTEKYNKAVEWLKIMKQTAIEVAQTWSDYLNINMPAAITTVKPSGTVSQLVGCSSGIHPAYSRYYIRRVRVASTDPLAKMMIDQKIPYKPEVGETLDRCTTYVFEFPIETPQSSVLRNDVDVIEQLEYWKMLQLYWCAHKPSATIYYEDNDWLKAGAWVYDNWDYLSGVSFLPKDGGLYELAPYEEINKQEYDILSSQMPNIDYTNLSMYEQEDYTIGKTEFACTGDKCDIL